MCVNKIVNNGGSLLPCPFCGADVVGEQDGNKPYWIVECLNGCVRREGFQSFGDMSETWNARSPINQDRKSKTTKQANGEICSMDPCDYCELKGGPACDGCNTSMMGLHNFQGRKLNHGAGAERKII